MMIQIPRVVAASWLLVVSLTSLTLAQNPATSNVTTIRRNGVTLVDENRGGLNALFESDCFRRIHLHHSSLE